MTQLILHITAQGVTAFERDGRELHEIGRFPADEAGQETFAAALNTLGRVPVGVLTDFIEEEFRVESLPHVRGRDRMALHQRHAARLFRATDFQHSRVVGRQQTQRRDDLVLFSALANPDLISRWLAVLDARKTPLAGIHSVAMLSERLVKPLDLAEDKVLLVTHNRNGGLRQTYLEQGKVRFSRLSPEYDCSPGGYARHIAGEISKTRRYLGSLQFLTPDEKLAVCVISGGPLLAALERCQDERLADQYQIHDVAGLAAKLGCHVAENEAFCDRLFVSLLAGGGKPNLYAAPAHLRHYQTYRLRRGLHATSLVTLCAALLWSGINVTDGLIFRERGMQTAQLAQQAQIRYDAMAGRLPDIPVNAGDIAAAVRVAGYIEAWRSQPGPLLMNISRGLGRHANLQVNEIAWRSDPGDNAGVDGEAQEIGMEDEALESEAEGDAREEVEYAVVKGEIEPFDGNYLRAHRDIESFARALRRQPQISEVEILTLPLNVSQAATVEGQFGRQRVEKAKFSVGIKMRRDDEKVL